MGGKPPEPTNKPTTYPYTQPDNSVTVDDETNHYTWGNYDSYTGAWQGWYNLDITLPEYFTPKVTALRSVNAALAADTKNKVTYIPTLSEFPYDVAEHVSNCTDYFKENKKFAAVYSGWHDPPIYDAQLYQPIKTRPFEVLGYDMLLKNDSVTFATIGAELKAEYAPEFVEDGKIEYYTALMNIYKSLGEYEYDIQYVFTEDKIDVNTSPLAQNLGLLLNSTQLDGSDGVAWVYMSRSSRDLYRAKADKDFTQLIEDLDMKYGKSIDTVVQFADGEYITLGDFCMLVHELMILYGEPLLTKQEEDLLIQVYGKNLPFYMAEDTTFFDGEDIFTAIKYLYAKGILDGEREEPYDWYSNLTINDMLEILMSVKDVSSRHTFKDVNINIDSELADLGYYETTMIGTDSPIVSMDTSAVATHYDYLVEKVEGVSIFTEGSTAYAAGFYVMGDGERNKIHMEDVKRTIIDPDTKEAIEREFYHFKIPRTYKSSYIKITCRGAETQYFRLKNKGGVYTISGVPKDNRANYIRKRTLYRTKFTDTDRTEHGYMDANTKIAYSGQRLSAVSGSFVMSFTVSSWNDLKKLKWKDGNQEHSFDELSTKGTQKIGKYTFHRGTIVEGTHLVPITVEGCSDISEFRSHILHTNEADKYGTYTLYCQNGKNALVNFSFFQKLGLASRYQELEDETILLTTKFNNIYLCPKQRWVIVGNTVFDIPNGIKLYYKKDGQLFVDFRAMMGWTNSQYLFSNSSTGEMSLCPVVSPTPSDAPLDDKVVKNLYPDDSLRVQMFMHGVEEGKSSVNRLVIPLTGLYPLANYFVFMGDEEATKDVGATDYLFVFKLRVSHDCDDSAARELLASLMGLSPPDDWVVYAHRLSKSETDANLNPADIIYVSYYGYCCAPIAVPTYKDALKAYNVTMSSIGVDDSVKASLPFFVSQNERASSGASIYNMNVNVWTKSGKPVTYGRAPRSFIDISKTKGVSSFRLMGESKPKVSYKGIAVSDFDMIPAPVGVVSSLVSMADMSKETFTKSTSNKLYVGTSLATVENNTLKIVGSKYGNLPDTFHILRSTSLGYVLSTSDLEKLVPSVEPSQDSKSRPSLNITDSLHSFDWERFTFTRLIERTDSAITIATIVILNIIPRIALFLFLSLIALSLITNVRFWVLFCDRIFDIYKFLTFQRQDVHTINTKRLFWTSILAMAMFGLFMDGTIINIFAWLVKFVGVFMSR